MNTRSSIKRHTKRTYSSNKSRDTEIEREYTRERKEVLIYDYIIAQLGSDKFPRSNPVSRANQEVKDKRKAFLLPKEEIKTIKEKNDIQSKRNYADVVRGYVPSKITILPPSFKNILLEEQGKKKDDSIDRKKEHKILEDYTNNFNRKNDFVNKNVKYTRKTIQVDRFFDDVNLIDDEEDIIETLVEVINRENITSIRIEPKHFKENHVRIRSKYKTLVLINFEVGGRDKIAIFKNLPRYPMFPELHGTIIDVSTKMVVNRSLPLPKDCLVDIAYTNENYDTTVSWTDYWVNFQHNLVLGNFVEGDNDVPVTPHGSRFYYPVPESYNFNRQELKVKYRDHTSNEASDIIDMRNNGMYMTDKNITINIGTEGIVLVVIRLFGETIYATHKAFNPPHLKEMFDEKIKYITSPLQENKPFYREGCDYSPFVYTYMITDEKFVSNSQYVVPPVQLLTQVMWAPSEDGKTYIDCPYNYEGKVECFEYNPHHTKDYKGGRNILQPPFVPDRHLWGILFYGIMSEQLQYTHDYSLVRSIAQENFTDGHFIIVTKYSDDGKILKNYKIMSRSYSIKHEFTGGNMNLYNVFNNMLGKLNDKNFIMASLFEDRVIIKDDNTSDFLGESENLDERYEVLMNKIEDVCYYTRDQEGIDETVNNSLPLFGRLKHNYYNVKCDEIRTLLNYKIKNGDSKASFWLMRYNIAVVFCNFVMCYSGNKFKESMNMLKKFYEDLERVTVFIYKASKDNNKIERIKSDNSSYLTKKKNAEVRKKIYGILESLKGGKINKKTIKNKLLNSNLGGVFYRIYSTLEKLDLLD